MGNTGISILVSTYNWPEALELSLLSINNQSILPNEIVIADDGSTPATKFFIERISPHLKVPVIHCWQNDEGFRLARIRNRALEKCNYPYIIQIDGDIICHKHFIKDHLSYQKPNYFVTGKRINLNESDTKKTLENKTLSYSSESNKNNKLSHKQRSPLAMTLLKPSKINNRIFKTVSGCNLAYWHKDAKAIGGYNEKIEGWGKEDDEFSQRLLNIGIKKRGLKFGAIQFHLMHKLQNMDNLEKNELIFQQSKLIK